MCLSIPSKVISIDENNFATVETLGVRRGVSLDLISEPVNIGDFVLIHVGFAMEKIDTQIALESLKSRLKSSIVAFKSFVSNSIKLESGLYI